MPRKPMTLSPEKNAFLHQDKEEVPERPSYVETSQPRVAFEDIVPVPPSEGRYTLSVRVTPDIIGRLQLISTKRKVQREEPWKQQDIVTQAIEEWVERHI